MNDHQMESKTVRNRFIDIAKALGILLIVWGHSGGWGPLGNAMYVINTFHVPLFFFLSALFMTTALSFAEFSKKRAIRLLKPYLIFGLIASFVYYLVTDNDIIKIGGVFHGNLSDLVWGCVEKVIYFPEHCGSFRHCLQV